MYNNEQARAQYLNKRFFAEGLTLESFLEDGYEAIAVHSNSTIFAANQALADMLGYPVKDLLGMNAWLLFSPKSVAKVSHKLASRSEEPYQAVMRRKDGSEGKIELKAKNIEVAGEPARAVIVRLVNA